MTKLATNQQLFETWNNSSGLGVEKTMFSLTV